LRRIQVIKLLLDVLCDLLGGDLSLLVRMWLEDLLCWPHLLPDAADEWYLPAVAHFERATQREKRALDTRDFKQDFIYCI
jgi:hypothetical protein